MIGRRIVTGVLFAIACAWLTACGDQPAPASTGAPASAAVSRETAVAPTLPTSYAFTLTSSCGERALLGDYRVTVVDEQVSDVESLGKTYLYEPTLAEVPTLQDLVNMAEHARPEEVIEYEVDETGAPRSLSLDPVPNGIDDEECYEVTDLQPLT